MQKVNTAYLLCDSRKFETKDEATRELNRLRSLCLRLKAKNNELHVILGLSITDSKVFTINMAYEKPKNQGGKKHAVCTQRITTVNRETGELYSYSPKPIAAPPHIHIMVKGNGASSNAETILKNLRKRNSENLFSKTHLKTQADIALAQSYIKDQSIILRHV